VDIFGWGMLAHAVSALSVFALGYVCVFPIIPSRTYISNIYCELLATIHLLLRPSLPPL
jgi:hypothetical protein